MLRRGDSIGVFQLEGTAMRSTLRSLHRRASMTSRRSSLCTGRADGGQHAP